MAEGFYRVTLTQLLYAQTIQNVLHFLGPAGGAEQLPALSAQVVGVWVAQVKGIQSQALKYIQVKTEFAQPGGPAPFNQPLNTPGTSSDSADLDPTKAIVWRLRTATSGKHGHGRVFIGGIHHNNFEQGITTANVVNAMQNLATNILTAWANADFTLCVGNKTAPLVYHPVIAFDVAPTAGHILKRTVGRGI